MRDIRINNFFVCIKLQFTPFFRGKSDGQAISPLDQLASALQSHLFLQRRR